MLILDKILFDAHFIDEEDEKMLATTNLPELVAQKASIAHVIRASIH
jgi:zinc transporter ZupT